MSLTIAQRSPILIAGTGITITSTGSTETISATATSATNFVTKTSNYTILSTDHIIYVDTSGGPFTLTLPSPASVSTSTTTQTFQIIDTKGFLSTNNLTLAPSGSEKIEGLATSRIFETDWAGWNITTNNVDWFIK
jgi:hypothetical protein